MAHQIQKFTDDLRHNVIDILAQDSLSNIILIADCTQLQEWCDIRVLTNDGQIDAIFSLYSDLNFLATSFWSRNVESLKRLMGDYSGKLGNKEFVAICTEKQLSQFREACIIIQPTKERQMIANKKQNYTVIANQNQSNCLCRMQNNSENYIDLVAHQHGHQTL
ncbi:MAG: hypothetical protein ACFFDQ_03140 [Candidatus Thorarchaeota archaeon]